MRPIVDVIHVGFPRTGTTWVQSNLLPNIDEFACIGKPYLVSFAFRELLNYFVSVDDFDFSPQFFQSAFQQEIEKHGNFFAPDKRRIISFELLSGELYSGWDAKRLIDRIWNTFGAPQIIVTIREQRDIIESLYRYYISGGGSLHLRDFLYKRNSPAVDVFGKEWLFNKFQYHKYITYCYEKFGKERVTVIPFEWLKTEPPRFAQRFLAACGINNKSETAEHEKVHPALSYLGLSILRKFNQFVSTPLSDSDFFQPLYYSYTKFSRAYSILDRMILSGISPSLRYIDMLKYPAWERLIKILRRDLRRIDDDWTIKQDIAERYGETNRITTGLTGLPLVELGYHVDS